MIVFDSSKYHKSKYGGIYLSYEEIERITEEIISDYKPSLLTEPHAVEYDDFLEGYLGATVMYQDIYTESAEDAILGCTVFNHQRIPVFDRENMRKDYIECNPRTIILDNSLITGDRKIQENITGLHEGGHLFFHSEELTQAGGQGLFEYDKSIIRCKNSDIKKAENLKNIRARTTEEWREWQATIFAVTMALPRKSLVIAVHELFDEYNIKTEQLIIDGSLCNISRADSIMYRLANLYDMSMEAIRYRLMKIGLFTTMKEYKEKHTHIQVPLFDI